jgi:hypothetical protein
MTSHIRCQQRPSVNTKNIVKHFVKLQKHRGEPGHTGQSKKTHTDERDSVFGVDREVRGAGVAFIETVV